MGGGLGDRQNVILRRLDKARCRELPDLWHPLVPGRLGRDVPNGIGSDLALYNRRAPRPVIVSFRRAVTTLVQRHLIEKTTYQGCVVIRRVLTPEQCRQADELRAEYDFHFEGMVRAEETGQYDMYLEHERWIEWFEQKLDIYRPQRNRAG